MALIVSLSPWETKYLKALTELHDVTVTLGKRDRTIFVRVNTILEKDRTIAEQQKSTRTLTNTIDKKNSIIEERDAVPLG
ncbi:unnamed protein product [Vitrella brassicaformis CCMP3155]|uniref:Uncharacterized protein n=1 Tax=Vitrella brassicaformis (strain CCMP3155) TaxID=1169540 RepID=A0A0G4FW22_VITBC|nr:unnamed protein product [Vitrella brassicaformis CCMP3155]|eukprot:CEM19303.1 unnamed protein product [Vitrella brassicaformis CCMP3155]